MGVTKAEAQRRHAITQAKNNSAKAKQDAIISGSKQSRFDNRGFNSSQSDGRGNVTFDHVTHAQFQAQKQAQIQAQKQKELQTVINRGQNLTQKQINDLQTAQQRQQAIINRANAVKNSTNRNQKLMINQQNKKIVQQAITKNSAEIKRLEQAVASQQKSLAYYKTPEGKAIERNRYNGLSRAQKRRGVPSPSSIISKAMSSNVARLNQLKKEKGIDTQTLSQSKKNQGQIFSQKSNQFGGYGSKSAQSKALEKAIAKTKREDPIGYQKAIDKSKAKKNKTIITGKGNVPSLIGGINLLTAKGQGVKESKVEDPFSQFGTNLTDRNPVVEFGRGFVEEGFNVGKSVVNIFDVGRDSFVNYFDPKSKNDIGNNSRPFKEKDFAESAPDKAIGGVIQGGFDIFKDPSKPKIENFSPPAQQGFKDAGEFGFNNPARSAGQIAFNFLPIGPVVKGVKAVSTGVKVAKNIQKVNKIAKGVKEKGIPQGIERVTKDDFIISQGVVDNPAVNPLTFVSFKGGRAPGKTTIVRAKQKDTLPDQIVNFGDLAKETKKMIGGQNKEKNVFVSDKLNPEKRLTLRKTEQMGDISTIAEGVNFDTKAITKGKPSEFKAVTNRPQDEFLAELVTGKNKQDVISFTETGSKGFKQPPRNEFGIAEKAGGHKGETLGSTGLDRKLLDVGLSTAKEPKFTNKKFFDIDLPGVDNNKGIAGSPGKAKAISQTKQENIKDLFRDNVKSTTKTTKQSTIKSQDAFISAGIIGVQATHTAVKQAPQLGLNLDVKPIQKNTPVLDLDVGQKTIQDSKITNIFKDPQKEKHRNPTIPRFDSIVDVATVPKMDLVPKTTTTNTPFVPIVEPPITPTITALPPGGLIGFPGIPGYPGIPKGLKRGKQSFDLLGINTEAPIPTNLGSFSTFGSNKALEKADKQLRNKSKQEVENFNFNDFIGGEPDKKSKRDSNFFDIDLPGEKKSKKKGKKNNSIFGSGDSIF